LAFQAREFGDLGCEVLPLRILAMEFKHEQSGFGAFFHHAVVDAESCFNQAAPGREYFLELDSRLCPFAYKDDKHGSLRRWFWFFRHVRCLFLKRNENMPVKNTPAYFEIEIALFNN
jgi:hypothetical protein